MIKEIMNVLIAILVEKLFDKCIQERNVKLSGFIKILILGGVIILLSCSEIFLEFVLKAELYKKYDKIVNGEAWNIVMSILVLIGIAYLYNDDNQVIYNFQKLVKKIKDFTAAAGDNETLYVFCGDMDIWGNGENYSEEFEQLIELQDKHKNMDIKIVCKHCMEPELIEELESGLYNYEEIFNEKRINEEQVKRIAYFKNKLKRCNFRFYKDPEDDYSSLRARVIKSAGRKRVLIYRELKRKEGFCAKVVFKLLKKEKEKKTIYEYKEVVNPEDYQLLHYIELADLKWKKCDEDLAKKIEDFCVNYCKKHSNIVEKRIAFVYAETYEIAHYRRARKEFPPFGVMYLAAAVREQCPEWIPKIIAISEENMDIVVENYDVIAFSVVSAYTVPLMEQCMERIGRRAFCIAGGYQAELEAEKWIKRGLVRLVLGGEGEESIVKLLNGNYRKSATYETIPGAIYMGRKSGKPKFRRKELPSYIDLNNISMPARDLLAEDKYIMSDRLVGTNCKMVHVLFSRGCSYNCAYCGVRREGNRKVRYRDVDNILQELEYLKNKGVEGFSIIDDCFLANKKKALSIINALEKVNLRWSLTARIDQIDDEILLALKKAQCLEIKFGVETGSNKILSKMNKGFCAEDAKRVLRLTKKYGIGTKAFIITGLPGEDDATNRETKEFLKELGKETIDRISLLRFVPLPGSAIFDNPEKYGIRSSIKTEMDYKCYKLYSGETNWWIDEEDFERRNRIYEDIKEFMSNIWDKI